MTLPIQFVKPSKAPQKAQVIDALSKSQLYKQTENKTLIYASFQGNSQLFASGYLRDYINRTTSHTHFVHCN